MNASKPIVPEVESKIYLIRGQKVMLDSDLALLYGVQTKVLNQAVRKETYRSRSPIRRAF